MFHVDISLLVPFIGTLVSHIVNHYYGQDGPRPPHRVRA